MPKFFPAQAKVSDLTFCAVISFLHCSRFVGPSPCESPPTATATVQDVGPRQIRDGQMRVGANLLRQHWSTLYLYDVDMTLTTLGS